MRKTLRGAVWIFLTLGSLAITAASFAYFQSGERPAFVIEKLPLAFESLYLFALRVHVAAAAFSLPGCLLLTSKAVLKRWPRFHRWCGRAVGLLILAALVPSGFYLALFARGGWGSTLGFWLSGALVFWAMMRSIRDARARRFASHRRYAFHVLGQLSVAVTSRALLFVLESFNLNPDTAYVIGLWVPVLGTALLVEFLADPPRFHSLFRRLHDIPIKAAGSLSRISSALPGRAASSDAGGR